MFTTRCSLILRLSLHGNQIGQESGNEATKDTLGGYCKSEPGSRQSVYPCFVLVCATPAGSTQVMLRASCLTLEIKEFRCFEMEIQEIKELRPTAGLFTFFYCHLKTTQFLYNRCLPLDVASFPDCPHMGTKEGMNRKII